MAKLTLDDISGGYQTAAAYNANNALIEAALENTLSRDGTTPNMMDADLDMNSYDINNVGNLNTTTLTLNGQVANAIYANRVLNGIVDPTTEGEDGDFYINTVDETIFGPKASGVWGTATSLVGSDGADGVVQTASNVGTGVGVFKQLTATDLEFYNVIAEDTRITVALATNDITIGLGVINEADIADLQSYLLASEVSAFGSTLIDDATAADARTTLGVDAAGTDNSTDVTLAGVGTYLSIAGQAITVDLITESDISDLGTYLTDITGENLNELADVVITTPAQGQALTYDEVSTNWVNGVVAGSGSGGGPDFLLGGM